MLGLRGEFQEERLVVAVHAVAIKRVSAECSEYNACVPLGLCSANSPVHLLIRRLPLINAAQKLRGEAAMDVVKQVLDVVLSWVPRLVCATAAVAATVASCSTRAGECGREREAKYGRL